MFLLFEDDYQGNSRVFADGTCIFAEFLGKELKSVPVIVFRNKTRTQL